MKKIFLDTNFLIDYILRTEYTYISKEVLRIGSLKGYIFCVSFLSVADFAYVARKLEKSLLYRYISLIIDLFEIIPNGRAHLKHAIDLSPKDFEDAVQYSTAISYGCECIISRNKKDFPFSEVPVMSGEEFLGSTYCKS